VVVWRAFNDFLKVERPQGGIPPSYFVIGDASAAEIDSLAKLFKAAS
jgi:hypothetical protein